MMWQKESRYKKAERLEQWHPHLAWWPVRVSTVNGVETWAWLIWVERKKFGEMEFHRLPEVK